MKPTTWAWVEKAEGDWKVARRECESRDAVYDAVCFHAQQCVEKYLKAVLEEWSADVPRSHDLGVLARWCAEVGLDSASQEKALERLTAYAVAFRYPGEEAGREEADEGLETAGRVRRLVRARLSLEG